MTILYTKEQLETVGINFPTLQGLNVKEVRINENNQVVAVVDVESDELYLLPQEPITTEEKVTYTIETTEKTDNKAMTTVIKQVKLLDGNGEHKNYFPSHIEYEQVDTGELDEEDNPIYETIEKEVVSETPIYLYTTEEVEKQQVNIEGKSLYYKEITETIETVTEQEPLLITVDDERWTEDLERVMIEKEIPLDDEIRGLPKSDNLRDDVNRIKVKMQNAHEIYGDMFANSNTTLEELKLAKINQLDEACNLAIINGFEYTIDNVKYLFSSSLSAQANFQGTDTLFKDGLITSAQWTVTNVETGKVERVEINQENFNNIKLLLFQHINSNIFKLRNVLQPLVEAANDKDEVNSVVWE